MKIKCLFLTVLVLVLASVGFAQKKKTTAAAMTPDAVVKNLYAAQKNAKTNPFDQAKRGLVDKYFIKDLADLIWKTSKTDTGWRNIDALYNSDEQLRDSNDPQITNLVVGKPTEDGDADNVYVKVTFKNHGKAAWSGFKLRREAKMWKVGNIEYSDGEDLASTLLYLTDKEFQKGYDEDQFFRGGYMVGKMQCMVEPTINRLFFRVTCDGQDGFKLYSVDGGENETAFIYTDDKGKQNGKFVFKNGAEDGTFIAEDGKFIDASGKEMKVSRMKSDESSNAPMGDNESENVSGELMVGKTDSVILYVGEETGDYAAYCFLNTSEAGRAILAKCKDKEQCEVKATLGDGAACTVPGLEATLSAEFRIVKVSSVKSLGRRK